MPLYTGIGGVVKEMKELSLGVGGAVKKAKNGYMGVNGVIKPFFDSLVGTVKLVPHTFQITSLTSGTDPYIDTEGLSGGLVSSTSYSRDGFSYNFLKNSTGGVDVNIRVPSDRGLLLAVKLCIYAPDGTLINPRINPDCSSFSSKIGVHIPSSSVSYTCRGCSAHCYDTLPANSISYNKKYSGDFYNTIDKNRFHDNNIQVYFGSEWAKEMTLTVYPIVLNGLTYDVIF